MRRIFTVYDSGLGIKRIARLLTQEGAPHPKPFRLPDGLAPASRLVRVSSPLRALPWLYPWVVVWNENPQAE